MKWDSVYAIVPVVTSLVGIVLTLFVIHTLIRYIDTPIVKASGRELSFILLGGILFCFLITYALLAKPSVIICSLQRFGVSFLQSPSLSLALLRIFYSPPLLLLFHPSQSTFILLLLFFPAHQPFTSPPLFASFRLPALFPVSCFSLVNARAESTVTWILAFVLWAVFFVTRCICH